MTSTVYGYDGNGYTIGDRVELHPGCDLWMRGAMYGTVVGMSCTPQDRVHVVLDKVAGKRYGCAEMFRRLD
jgi:hypothetical protein